VNDGLTPDLVVEAEELTLRFLEPRAGGTFDEIVSWNAEQLEYPASLDY